MFIAVTESNGFILQYVEIPNHEVTRPTLSKVIWDAIDLRVFNGRLKIYYAIEQPYLPENWHYAGNGTLDSYDTLEKALRFERLRNTVQEFLDDTILLRKLTNYKRIKYTWAHFWAEVLPGF